MTRTRSAWLLLCLAATFPGAAHAEQRPPNLVVILCDNLGYGDIACFGSKRHRTPHIDRLAVEGTRFTHFYSTSGVCTPSRASLMTGCYPRRVGLHVNDRNGAVLQPVEPIGLHPDEVTIAEVLKKQGYATALIGKWHLGDQPPFLPTRQGFDHYLGIPYSDDMTPRQGRPWPPLPLMRGDRVIEAPVDRNLLTRRYTEESIAFMTAQRDRPFFLLLSHAMPGSTLAPYASADFRGKSANGPWGDSVEEIDWSTGQIVAALKRLGLEDNTLLLWTSDNGAPRRDPPQGSNLPLAGWGYTVAEGGMRVPLIARWPGHVPAGRTCTDLCTMMDLLPTFANLAGGQPPQDRTIDGKDITPLLTGRERDRSPHEAFFYYHLGQLQAVRSGPWKLYLPLVSNKSADVSNNPDAVFLTWDTIESKRASLVPRAARPGTFREIIGTPDWILEIVSDSSIHKDTKRLRDAYHKAGIPEYWLVDARGDEVVFQILTWKTSGYVAAARRGGWQKSRTYSCSFRLDRHRNRVGHWAYRLHVR